jgi:hypothetical protein
LENLYKKSENLCKNQERTTFSRKSNNVHREDNNDNSTTRPKANNSIKDQCKQKKKGGGGKNGRLALIPAQGNAASAFYDNISLDATNHVPNALSPPINNQVTIILPLKLPYFSKALAPTFHSLISRSIIHIHTTDHQFALLPTPFGRRPGSYRYTIQG